MLGAGIVIEAGHHALLPNSAGQRIEIRVSGGVEVAGLNFKAQVGDGFPDVPDSMVDGPNITDVDIVGTLTATIFTPNHAGQQDPGSAPQVALRTATTQSGLVTAEGLLATLTIDTTGFSEGTFALRLGDTYAGPTEFLDAEAQVLPTQITDGTLKIVSNVAPPIAVTRVGNDIHLAWSGTNQKLEEADSVEGPWRLVEGSPTSVYVVQPTASRRFFRLQ